MKLSILVILSSTFTISTSFAGNIPLPTPIKAEIQVMSVGGPKPSPTNPEKGGDVTLKQDLSLEEQYASAFYTVEDLSKFDSVKTTINDENGNSYSFIQFKQLDESYSIFIPQSVYDKMKIEGVVLDQKQVQVISDKQYILLSKQVQINTFAKINSSDYLGGEGGRCAAGTIGSAIGGAIAGGAVAGPAGAVAGAIGGALYGSAGNCK